MWQSDELKNHLQSSFTISSQSALVAEWNMNVPGNIFKLGNYRYRKDSPAYSVLPNIFDRIDSGNYYTNATDSDIVIENGLETDGVTPLLFTFSKDIEKLYYSLEDCIKPFRPRSGINKASFFNNKYLSNPNANMFQRPRYYMPHRDDIFKYWRSYRTESKALEDGYVEIMSDSIPITLTMNNSNIEYGISKNSSNGVYPIDDCVPFVVYKKPVPANRLVVKIQTNVGDIDLGPFKTTATSSFNDPFFGDANKTIPKVFKVQYLDEYDEWIDAYSFNANSTRSDNTPLFGTDGYLSLEYGLEVPDAYKDNFLLVGTVANSNILPDSNIEGYAYFVIPDSNTRGTLFVYNGTDYDEIVPRYSWKIGTDGVYENTQFVTDFTNPSWFKDGTSGEVTTQVVSNKIYREFVFIKGMRIVVDTMNLPNVPLELIEMSPRLVADLSDKMISFAVSKILSDLGNSALPVGQLSASTGNLQLFDDDQAFNQNNVWNFETNTGSIIAEYMQKNIKFNFYEVIKNVNNINYYVPIKTLYSDNVPQIDQLAGTMSFTLRDFYFYFESVKAPEILLTDVSLSQAVCILLDHIGFSNYVIKRLSTETDPVIPYFFVGPEQNVAEVLQQIAIATQSAMFFDEYNNFVVMTKGYLLDNSGERLSDMVLYGSNYPVEQGIIENVYTPPLTNIASISSQEQRVYNDGNITYTERYIQRSYGTIRQAQMIDQDKTWIYKPVLLWEVSGTATTKSANNTMQSNYNLAAMPLNSDLVASPPTVVNRLLINNTIDFGENVYWLGRYQGYFYSNGEIIRYDAVEYNVPKVGNVWITSNLEYQKYFSSIPFNGKMYPTGLVRIYAEPYYETIDGLLKLKNGDVVQHGRGQFNTPLQYHNSGLNSYWSDNSYVQGCDMQSEFLFTTAVNLNFNISGVSSSGTSFTLPDIAGIDVGQYVKVISGTGTLSGITTVTSINTLKNPTTGLYTITVSLSPSVNLNNATVNFSSVPLTVLGDAGVSKTQAEKSKRNGIIKNFFSTSFATETDVADLKTTQTGTIQSSAFVFSGPVFETTAKPRDFVSYVWKQLERPYQHFGTRMRIIGKIESAGEYKQTPIGSTTYFTITGSDPSKNVTLGGGSGGISIVNPTTNQGYYFEISALTQSNIESYIRADANQQARISLDNILFYKVKKNTSSTRAVPIKMWGGIGNIIVDNGAFTGQYRIANEDNPTVYDLSIEYVDVSPTLRTFYLYINNKLVQVVSDDDPLPLSGNTVGLFVRGSSKVMFENIYALSQNYSQNSSFKTGYRVGSVFGDDDSFINASEALTKYAVSGVIQKTFLKGIYPAVVPMYNLYFEEFGTIMRECAYFKIKYDKAYPALYAKISETFNRLKGYVVSGFMAESYGAEFLVFNATDKSLNLDETSGNYLRIQGVTFTQDTTHTLTVDEYYKKRGNLSDPELQGETVIRSPYKFIEEYEKIRTSRLKYGKNEFSLTSPYIQTQDSAEELLGWIIEKVSRPRKLIGLEVFSMPTLQLGDIVNINYKDENGLDLVTSASTKFVIYQIEYSKSLDGPNMILYLSEV